MNYNELVNQVNSINENTEINKIVENIDINENNFDQWVNDIFSEKINMFDMSKLPYLIDGLYHTDNKIKFMLCCMLLESSCDKLEFITNLEKYPLFVAKFESLVNTLVTVYDAVDNGIANCMSLIIINNDPKFEYFDIELKNRLIEATKRKLSDILDYLKKGDINPIVYNDLEVIIDMACYLKNNDISNLINEIDKIENNTNTDIFIMKYNIINDIDISMDKLNKIKSNSENIWLLYHVMEELGINDKYLSDISQEQIAKSDMIKWLSYPTELGSIPDKIELLGSFNYDDSICYAYKFSKEGFKIEGDLLGVSGSYPKDKITSNASGYTFSKFEKLSDDWEKQSFELVKFISDYWKNRNN